MAALPFTPISISETTIEYRFGDAISLTTSEQVLSSYYTLLEQLDLDAWHITDILPTYTTIAVYFTINSLLFDDINALNDTLAKAVRHPLKHQGRQFDIPVSYTGEDLQSLAKHLELSVDELIARHIGRSYPIAMLGFRPYFPYLLGLDEKLHTPRRETPRTRVPKGAVAIGSAQTGIYPEASPGGWHIIGYTDFDDFEKLKAGDTIRFIKKEA